MSAAGTTGEVEKANFLAHDPREKIMNSTIATEKILPVKLLSPIAFILKLFGF